MSAKSLYPAIEPYWSGTLDVGDGHALYVETCGNPDGRPVVVIHGGPGAGCTPNQRRFFDPAVYRIVLFDQRGAGRSQPLASVENNTTADLVRDIEAVRRSLGIDKWLVFGGSWGSTLALAYAGAHPEALAGLILRGIWLCRDEDVRWWLYDSARIFPDHWEVFANYIPRAERDDLVEAYWRRMIDPDPAVHMPAAIAWRTYEHHGERLLPSDDGAVSPSQHILAVSRIEAHYVRNRAFLAPNALIDGVPRFRQVPGVIVHGRYDMLCTIDGAAALAAAWPEADFRIVPDAGHSAFEPGITAELVEAADRFARMENWKS